MVERTRRELTDYEVENIARTCRAWRGERGAGEYADVPGFCKSASLDEIRLHEHVLTPGRYVGTDALPGDDSPFPARFAALKSKLGEHFQEGQRLQGLITNGLNRLSQESDDA